jgi:hypothetical protein
MDGHADQCCIGDNALILYEWPNETVEVSPFLESVGSVASAPIVTEALAYDDPNTGSSALLVIYQAIYIKGLKHNLLYPMQLRHSGLTVNDRPRNCTPIPTREDNAIVIPDGNYMIPMELHGITSEARETKRLYGRVQTSFVIFASS